MVAHSQPKGKMSIYGKTTIILMDGRRKWNIVASRKWIVNKSKNNEFNKREKILINCKINTRISPFKIIPINIMGTATG